MSFDPRGHILKEATPKIEVIVILVLRHFGGSEIGKDFRKGFETQKFPKEGDYSSRGLDEAYLKRDHEGSVNRRKER